MKRKKYRKANMSSRIRSGYTDNFDDILNENTRMSSCMIRFILQNAVDNGKAF